MKIQLRHSWNSCDEYSRPPRAAQRIFNRSHIVVRVQLAVKHDVVPDPWHVVSPVHARMAVSGNRIQFFVYDSESAAQEIAVGQRVAAFPSDGRRAAKPQFQARPRLETYFLSVNKRTRNKPVPAQPSD